MANYISTSTTNDGATNVRLGDKLMIGADSNPVAALHVTGAGLFTGNITAYYSSDITLKDNVRPIESAIFKVQQIRGVEFDWNEKSPGWARERGHDVGVVAQEIQKVLPEIVTERKNGYLGVDYKRIVPLLIESIKELKEEVEELKKKVN